MKKLVGLLALLFCGTAYADYVVVSPYISGADVTISALNNNQNAIVNTLNGNVEGTINIKAGSINTVDLAQAVSPVVRWSESFNDYTVTGMLGVTDSDLSSDISAGVSYVNGYRIQLSATAHTYSASRDTFVYINEGGYYEFCEEPNGTDACGTAPSNAMLLFEAVTSGTAITGINDLRTLSIQITTTTTNFPADYRDQAFVSRDSATTFHVEPGSVAIGNTIYTRTSDTSTKSLTNSVNWIEGGYAPGATATVFIYAYNDAGSTFDFKFSSNDVVYSDTSNNTNGVKRYYATGGVYYRAIGWLYVSADTVAGHEFGNIKDVNVQNNVMFRSESSQTLAQTSFTPMNDSIVHFYSTGKSVDSDYLLSSTEAGVTAAITGIHLIQNIDGGDITASESQAGGATNGYTQQAFNKYLHMPSQGMHTYKVNYKMHGSSSMPAGNRVYELKEQ